MYFLSGCVLPIGETVMTPFIYVQKLIYTSTSRNSSDDNFCLITENTIKDQESPWIEPMLQQDRNIDSSGIPPHSHFPCICTVLGNGFQKKYPLASPPTSGYVILPIKFCFDAFFVALYIMADKLDIVFPFLFRVLIAALLSVVIHLELKVLDDLGF